MHFWLTTRSLGLFEFAFKGIRSKISEISPPLGQQLRGILYAFDDLRGTPLFDGMGFQFRRELLRAEARAGTVESRFANSECERAFLKRHKMVGGFPCKFLKLNLNISLSGDFRILIIRRKCRFVCHMSKSSWMICTNGYREVRLRHYLEKTLQATLRTKK